MKKTIVAALCAAAALSHVQAAPVFQINSTLTDLSYKIVDLTPNDGLTAGYSVNSNTLTVSLRDSPNTPNYGVMDPTIVWPISTSASMFDSSTATQTLTDGLATGGKNGNSLYSSVGIDRADLDNLGSDFFSVFRGNYTPRVVSNSASIESLWVLAPHTEVTITGHALLSLLVDGAPLLDQQALVANGLKSITLQARGSVGLGVSDTYLYDPSTGFYQPYQTGTSVPSVGAGLTGQDLVYSSGVIDIGANSGSVDQTFSITIRNTSNQNMLAKWGGGSFAEAFWVGKIDPGVPQVPEPGTWALMGLGLGLMAWRVKRG